MWGRQGKGSSFCQRGGARSTHSLLSSQRDPGSLGQHGKYPVCPAGGGRDPGLKGPGGRVFSPQASPGSSPPFHPQAARSAGAQAGRRPGQSSGRGAPRTGLSRSWAVRLWEGGPCAGTGAGGPQAWAWLHVRATSPPAGGGVAPLPLLGLEGGQGAGLSPTHHGHPQIPTHSSPRPAWRMAP